MSPSAKPLIEVVSIVDDWESCHYFRLLIIAYIILIGSHVFVYAYLLIAVFIRRTAFDKTAMSRRIFAKLVKQTA